MVLYAQWGHVVTWDSQGGTVPDPVVKNQGQQLGSLPTSTKDGYVLSGWYTAPEGGTKIEPTTTVETSTTYYAHWAGKTYKYTTRYYISLEDRVFSQEEKLWSSIPKGRYNMTFKNISIKHYGSTTSHRLALLICIKNPSDKNGFYHINLANSNTSRHGGNGLGFQTITLHTHPGGSDGRSKEETISVLYGGGYGKNEGSGSFTLTINNIDFKHAQNSVWIQLAVV